MFTRNSWLSIGLLATAAWAQSIQPDAASAIRVNLAPNAPVQVVSTDLGDSRIQARGGAMVLDLHATVVLRNNAPQNVRGVTLVVLAQEMTPGGKGSVAIPSLNIPSGKTFPVRINLRLLRPLPAPAGPLVEVGLDGVLFSDFSFFGPNRLEFAHKLTVWEQEARRDRDYLRSVLSQKGADGLQQEMLASLTRQSDGGAPGARLDVQVSRPTRAISAAVSALTAHNLNFAFLRLPDSPLELLSGAVQVNGSEAFSPRVEVANRSNRPVRYFEVGWIVEDSAGRQYLAGSIPASSSALDLAPGRSTSATQDRTFRFSRGPDPASIAKMSGFVSQVEFADGSIWIPTRKALRETPLLGVLPVSAEEQRLSEIYHSKGLQALIEELNKF